MLEPWGLVAAAEVSSAVQTLITPRPDVSLGSRATSEVWV